MVNIGINGFGRLGRLLLKVAVDKIKKKGGCDAAKVVMVNDANMNEQNVATMLLRDSIYGNDKTNITSTGSELVIDGQKIAITKERQITKIPWKKCQVDYVIDTTGKNINCDEASKFLVNGVKRVIVSGCSKVPIFIVGVNHCCFELKMTAVSGGTPQLNCLMPILKVLHEAFEIVVATSTAIHPISNGENLQDDFSDLCGRNWKGSFMNLIPVESNTKPKYVERIMSELEDKTSANAVKAPVCIAGIVDVAIRFGKDIPFEVIKCRLKEASESQMKGIMRVACENEDLSSSDIIGESHSCVIDANASFPHSKRVIKIFAWYNTELSFAARLYDLANYMSSRESCSKT